MPAITPTHLPNTKAIAHFNGKALITNQDYQNLKAYEHAIAFTVAKMADKDMLTEVHKAIKQAIESGTTFADFKKRLKPYLMAKGWLVPTFKNNNKETLKAYNKHLGHRLNTIYQTNIATAYAAGRWQRIQHTKTLLPYLQYMPSTSRHKRDEHKAYYGIVRHVDDPIWQKIFPPNGYGCHCSTRSLTQQEAEKIGITDDDTIANLPNVDDGFDHNHDRLSALIRLAKDRHGKAFKETLEKQVDDYMVGLIKKPFYQVSTPTIFSPHFVARFHQLQQAVNQHGGHRGNSMALRKALSQGDKWAIATISPTIQAQLGSKTAIVWLSDDTVIKMLAHHPEQTTLELLQNTHAILMNAIIIIKDDEFNVVYYSVDGKYYKSTIKTTKDKSELYLTTIFKMDEKEFYRDINSKRKKGREFLKEKE